MKAIHKTYRIEVPLEEVSEALVDPDQIEEWSGGKWKEPSLLTIELHGDDGDTRVELVQENVPDNECEDIDKGWDNYYFGPLKEYLEETP